MRLPSPNYKVVTIEESLRILEPMKIVGVDTETSGLRVYQDKLLLLQLGNKENQVVIDCTTVDIIEYKAFLESKRLFLFWNAIFDLQWTLHHHILVYNIYDGMLAEKLMWLGYPSGIHSMSLKSAAHNYLGIELDKSVRGKIIWSKELSDDIIIYAAKDVEFLEDIYNLQIQKLREKDLLLAAKLECDFVKIITYYKYCGVKIDQAKWKIKMQKDQAKMNEALNELNQWVLTNKANSKYVTIDNQLDLFSGECGGVYCNINWDSDKQVKELFKELGFNLQVRDKETGELKDSIEAKVIESQIDVSPIAPIYLKYAKAAKVVQTYGQNVLDLINPVTQRIHTELYQLGTDTGRISSGKDRENNLEGLNLQNFPADKETRACFIAEEGNVFISCDYSAQESRVIANEANEQSMIDLFKSNGDMHSLVAKMAYPDVIGDCPIEEIKSKFKHIRQLAKSVEFSINYGGSADTISRNNNIPIEEAQTVYDNYMKGFPGVKSFQDYQKKFVMQNGYILLCRLTHHKAYIYDFELLKKIESRLTYDFYKKAKPYKGLENKQLPKPVVNQLCERFANGEPVENLVGVYTYTKKKAGKEVTESIFVDIEDAYRWPIKKYFKRKADCEKQACDYPIQGASAVMFKLANIYFYDYLLQNNLIFKVKLCIPAHDEIDVEAPEEMQEEIARVLQECMARAGAKLCSLLEIPAEASRLSICIKDFIVDGEVKASVGDIIDVGEKEFDNLTKNLTWKGSFNSKEYFNPDGPFPTYWIH